VSSIFKINAIAALIKLLTIASVAATGSSTEAQSATSTENTPTPLKTFQIYHAFRTNEFKPRGTIQLTTSTEDGSVVASVHGQEGSLDKAVFEEMDAVVSSGGFYKVKVVDEESGASSLASVPGCDVRRANFREEIELTLGNTGSIISISYKPLASPLAPQCHELESLTDASKEREFAFKTTVSYSTSNPGMTIPSVLPTTNPAPGYNWIKRLKSPGDNGNAGGGAGAGAEDGGGTFDPEGEAGPQHQSFLRRYWYIALPVAIMTLLGPAEEPQQGAGQGAAVAAGAAAAGGRKRRGKRG